MILPTSPPGEPSSRAPMRRFVSYGWAALLSLTVLSAYVHRPPAVLPVGADTWPQELWVGLSIMAFSFCLLAALLPQRIFSRAKRWIEGPALAFLAGLAVARIGYLLGGSTDPETKALLVLLWAGPLVIIWLYMSSLAEHLQPREE